MKTNQVIKKLELIPHYEGGYYKRIWESDISFLNQASNSSYKLASCILYLLPAGEISHLHYLKSDEIWVFNGGVSLDLFLFKTDNTFDKITLGNDLLDGNIPNYIIKAGTVFSAKSDFKEGYSLISCFVSPEFKESDFNFANSEELKIRFNNYENIIDNLSKK